MTPDLDLLPQHQRLIVDSAIAAAVAEARGYRTVRTRADLRRFGFSESQARVPALLIPIHNVRGETSLYQIRPDLPRVVDGKSLKYETPRGARMAIDVPPPARSWLGVPERPLFITEGSRKADAAVSRDLCCVALLGVWNWRGKNDDGGLTALGDWECIHLKGRHVYVAFDSDVTTKPAVRGALIRLKAFLESRGAAVKIIQLPAGEGGSKVGLDDFLASGRAVDDLMALASSDVPRSPNDSDDDQTYQATAEGLVYLKPTREGSIPVRLTNFTAVITADISLDDGAEIQRAFEVEATLDHRSVRFTVPASQFSAMRWPIEHLGSGAVIYPGFGATDHARAAIQIRSGSAPRRSVYAHIGWREIDGAWVYLHSDGGIGAAGPVQGIEVRLRDPLTRYRLPAPPEKERLSKAIRSSLSLLRAAPLRLTGPLCCATWRAALGSTDVAVHLSGPTGAFKTELASLVQRHFGAGMDSRRLPGSWSSTANSLEAAAFMAKDAVLVVDDFAPGGTVHDVQRFHRDADRLIRAQGNNTGRGRMSSDCTLRPSKPPRGLILSTGEDVPRGHSLRARMIILEAGPNDVDKARLSACQRDAEAGLYAEAMAGFLQYVAPQYLAIRDRLRARVLELRDRPGQTAGHLRTPDGIANLASGFEVFLAFAKEVGALSADEAKALWNEAWQALQQVASEQHRYHMQAEPARRFIELIGSAITSGRCHLAAADGDCSTNLTAWGWRQVTFGTGDNERTEWRPQGDQIGWIDEQGVYLDSSAALAAAQRLSEAMGEPLSITAPTLHRRLHQRGFLASTDTQRDKLLIRRTLSGKRQYVLHVRLSALSPPTEQAQQAQSASDGAEPRDWACSWAGPGANRPTSDEPNLSDKESNFSNGPVGPVSAPREPLNRAPPDIEPDLWACHPENGPTNRPNVANGVNTDSSDMPPATATSAATDVRRRGDDRPSVAEKRAGPLPIIEVRPGETEDEAWERVAARRGAAGARAEAERLHRLGRTSEARAFEESAAAAQRIADLADGEGDLG